MSKIQSLDKENSLESLQEDLGKHRTRLSLLVKKEQINQQMINLQNQINKTNDECNMLLREKILLEDKSTNLQDFSKMLDENRQKLDQSMPEGQDNNAIILEFCMARMAENTKRQNALILLLKKKQEILKKVVSKGQG